MKIIFRIALRQLMSKHNFGFISFSSILSMIGLMIGVASLIIISSISNGFNYVVNNKLSSIDGHLRVQSISSNKITSSEIFFIDSVFKNIISENYNTYPYIEKHSILRNGKNSEGVIVYGVDEDALNEIFILDSFSKIKSNFIKENSIIIGSKLAELLNISINDKIILLNPEHLISKQFLKAKIYYVVNIFKTDFPEYDKMLCFIPFDTAQKQYNYESSATGVIMNTGNAYNIDKQSSLLEESLKEYPLITTSWKERHFSLLNWLNIYDVPIKMIMFFIIIVGIFNICASLWMIVLEKSKDFGILQALGLSKSQIEKIIVVEGAIIGFYGSILGVILSLILLFLEVNFHFIKIPSDIYFMSYLPIKISFNYFIIYPLAAFLFTILFSIIPAKLSSNLNILDAMRYE